MPSKEEIEAERTAKGGYTKETLAKWGVSWPPPKGWKDRLISSYVIEQAAKKYSRVLKRLADS